MNFFKKIFKAILILIYFKNPITVINFFRGKFIKGVKVRVLPRNGEPFYISRFGDIWILEKIIKGEKIILSKEEDDYIIESGIYLRQGTSDTFVYKEVFMENCYKKYKSLLNKNSIVIDIGAHIGTFSLYCGPFCKKIYSYEAHFGNFQLALKNIKSKNQNNIKLVNMAAWSKSGIKLSIKDAYDKSGEHKISKDNKGGALVDTISLQDIFELNNIQVCDLLKMDIEGAEYEVFFSAPENILNKIKNISMEYHPDLEKKHNIEDLKNLLIKNNFKVETEIINFETGILNAEKIIK